MDQFLELTYKEIVLEVDQQMNGDGILGNLVATTAAAILVGLLVKTLAVNSLMYGNIPVKNAKIYIALAATSGFFITDQIPMSQPTRRVLPLWSLRKTMF